MKVDPDLLDALLRRVEGELPALSSAQVAVAQHGTLVAQVTFGDARVPAPAGVHGSPQTAPAGVHGSPQTAPARYLLQSAGRTLVASAAWKLLGEGLLRLDEKVADVIPEFAANGKEAVTVEHALTHTGGFPFAPLGYPKMADRALRLAAFAKWRLDEPPGLTLQFHLTSVAWLIAEFVERRTGLALPAYLRTAICKPLGLGLELAVPAAEQRASVVPMVCTSGDPSQVDPWGPWYLDDPEVVAAGEPAHSVVGSAAGVALHYQALLAALDGDASIWDPATVADAVRARVTAVPAGDATYGGGTRRTSVGLFVVVRGPDAGSLMPSAASPAAFGNGGAAYQLGFADPATGLSFALLSNGYPASGYDTSAHGRKMLADLGNLAAGLVSPGGNP